MKAGSKILRDFFWIAVSVVVAWLLVQLGVVDWILGFSKEFRVLTAFLGGMFFVSIFTAVPAIAVITELAHEMSPTTIAIFGGLGSLLGDLIILHFIKEELTDDVNLWIEKVKNQGFFSIFRSRYFRWLAAVLGAIVIASPLPDELGIAIIGVSKIQTKVFVPLSFILNGAGILLIALAARAV